MRTPRPLGRWAAGAEGANRDGVLDEEYAKDTIIETNRQTNHLTLRECERYGLRLRAGGILWILFALFVLFVLLALDDG